MHIGWNWYSGRCHVCGPRSPAPALGHCPSLPLGKCGAHLRSTGGRKDWGLVLRRPGVQLWHGLTWQRTSLRRPYRAAALPLAHLYKGAPDRAPFPLLSSLSSPDPVALVPHLVAFKKNLPSILNIFVFSPVTAFLLTSVGSCSVTSKW